jgi:type III secretion protein J
MDCSLHPGHRAAARLAIAVLAVVTLCSCKSELYARVSERDANEILATLYGAGIHAAKNSRDEKSWSVQVEERDLQRALTLLNQHGLPHEQFSTTGELFKKEGLISTPSEERIRYIYAVSQELSNTLSQIDGVVAARVHPVIPANDPLATRIRPASAAIFIKHRAGANLQAMSPAIKNLVMRSIEGLEYENISLTFVTAEAQVAKPGPAVEGRPVAKAGIGLGELGLVAAVGGAISLVLAWRARRRREPEVSPRNSWADEVR